MLNKQEFTAVAAGDFEAYRRASRRRSILELAVVAVVAGIVAVAAYPAWRDAQRFASLDFDSTAAAFGVRR